MPKRDRRLASRQRAARTTRPFGGFLNKRDEDAYRQHFERAKRGELLEGPNVLCPDCGTWMSVPDAREHDCLKASATQ